MRTIDPTTAATNATNTIDKEIETTAGAIIREVADFAKDDTRPARSTLSLLEQLNGAVTCVFDLVMTTDGSNALYGGQNVVGIGGSVAQQQPSSSNGSAMAQLADDLGTDEARVTREVNNLVRPLFAPGIDDAKRTTRSTVAEKVVSGNPVYEVQSNGTLVMETEKRNLERQLADFQDILQELQGKTPAEKRKLLAGMLNVANGTIEVQNNGTLVPSNDAQQLQQAQTDLAAAQTELQQARTDRDFWGNLTKKTGNPENWESSWTSHDCDLKDGVLTDQENTALTRALRP